MLKPYTVNGIPLNVASQSFSASIPLTQEGANTLTFTATDLAGNVGTLTVQTVRRTLPPVLRITSPMDGFSTADAVVPVTGTVSDPSAAVTVQGQTVAVDSQGNFTALVGAQQEGHLAIVAQATDVLGNSSQSVVYVAFAFHPPVLTWINPTPPSGAQLTSPSLTAAVALDKAALTAINGQRVELQPGPSVAQPFQAQATLAVQEGQVLLTATAVDGAGNTATITRTLGVGLTTPALTVSAPVFDASGSFSTANLGVTLAGQVTASAFVQPIAFTVNGAAAALAADGTFSVPLALVPGANPVLLLATSAYGQSVSQSYTVNRSGGILPAGSWPGISIDWPQPGFATSSPSMAVTGHVTVPGMTASLNGVAVAVDPQALTFSASVPLQVGVNVITAQGSDAQGRQASATVTGSWVPAGSASYAWTAPLAGSHSSTRAVAITGSASMPGIVALTVNDVAMTLANGSFSGSVSLQNAGPNALLLVATALDGSTQQATRTVSFEPALPQVVLSAPATARPGDLISLQASPGAGSNLVKVDLTWNGLFLATVTAPWAAVSAQVPASAPVGSSLAVSALGTDDQGATVTARTSVSVYASGALVVQAFDDRLGLPFTDQTGTATVEGGASQTLDGSGRAALATALPQNWLLLQKPGFSPVWRSAALTVGATQTAVSARLTPLGTSQSSDGTTTSGTFGGNALQLALPAGAMAAGTAWSVTPLSSHGLPGLLPLGWSALSAWWLDLGGASLLSPGSASLNLAGPLAPA